MAAPSLLNVNALTTISTLETELGLTPGAQDVVLSQIINTQSAFIESYCNRKFYYEADIVENLRGFGTKFLHVARTPVVSISSITFDGGTVESGDYEIHNADSGSIYSLGEWTWTTCAVPNLGQDPLPGSERKLYQVTYTGGWVTPQQGVLPLVRNLPYDLEDACVMLCTWRYRWIGKDPTVKSETLMSASQTFASTSATTGKDPLQAMMPGVWSILQRYKRAPIGT